MFSFLHKNKVEFLSKQETETVLNCVRENERFTSGEIRICIESRCPYVEPMDRARELFQQLKMHNTQHRNAILIYIAHLDKDFALFGDKNIYEKIETKFWNTESKKLSLAFSNSDYVNGICTYINAVGTLLKNEFPLQGEQKNELPDEIVFGK